MKRKGIVILAIIAFGVFLWLIYMNGYKRGSWYLIDATGNRVSNIGYEDCKGVIEIEDKHFFVFTKRNRFSTKIPFYKETFFIVDNEGKTIFKGDSKRIEIDDLHNLIQDKGRYIIIDAKGKTIYKAPKDKGIEDGTNYFGVVPFYYRDENVSEDDRRYGYINMQDEVILEPQFKRADPIGKDGLACVVTEEGKYGFIDAKGEYAIPPIYDYADEFSDGLAQVALGEKREYVDTEGTVVLEKEGGYFHEGFASIKNESGKEAYMDKNGELITDYDYDIAYPFYNGYAIATIDGLDGAIDTKGEIIIEPKFKNLGLFSEDGLAALKGDNGFYGFINTKGEWQIAAQYENVYDYRDGVAAVKEAAK
ncbi:WG repeat-containing protein [Butyrivibrio sp. X503]|uniref:WG repeat-containing protein n=1 Tax=Butyrivibrio sp. X503 TaxID=2364878 RepID=UPI0013142364|nr:WG repeat-containing protein [Butyrivibrio sp. X503]